MRLVLSWLREFVDVPASAEEIAEPLAAEDEPIDSIDLRDSDPKPEPETAPADTAAADDTPAERQKFSSKVDDVFSRIKTSDEPGVATLLATSQVTAPVEGDDAKPTDDRPKRARKRPIQPSGLTSAAPVASDAEVGNSQPEATQGSDRVAVHRRDAQVAGPARDLARQLKLALQDEQNVLLELVRASGDQLNDEQLPDGTQARSVYVEIAGRELLGAAQAGWGTLQPKAEVPDAIDVSQAAEELATALTERIQTSMRAALAGDGAVLAERVRVLYREVRNKMVVEVAQHGALAAFSAGQVAAAANDKAVQVRWVFEACGPDCLDNSLAGQQLLGSRFPTGHLRPPAFVGCRCLMVRIDS